MSYTDTVQVVENDLVAARQTDRSIGSHDFNRLVNAKCDSGIVF